ncbi:MAG: MFS transporter [Chloroflexi bacterium]|nr:MFS transporter [Chloroflexota bacterium]
MGPQFDRTRWNRNLVLWRLVGALVAVVAALAIVLPAFADEQHGTGVPDFETGPLLWGLVSLAGVFLLLGLSRTLLVGRMAKQAAGAAADVGYFAAMRQFSRNARLFLTYSILSGLGSGIWGVMFNLYLLRVGYPIEFIGTFWLINMLCHGAGALPAGLIADRYGRRKAFVIATTISLVAQGTLLFLQDPLVILILAGISGFGDAFHGVTGAPFMMENSEPHERTHLFSLNAAFMNVSSFVGSLSGGLLPLLWATILVVPALEPAAARSALVTGLPLTLLALVPLAFMREKPVELIASFKDMVTLRYVEHFGIIARFTLLNLMVGAGFGLTVRFFNVFFQEAHNASDSQVGTVIALASIAGAGSVLVSPILAQHWGKAKSIFFTQGISIPFLLLMAVVPSFSAVTVFYLMRAAIYSIGMPLRNQLSMEFISSRERGTAAGFTHTAFDLGGGVGAGIAGLLITTEGFVPAFTAAAILILIPAVLYYVFFDNMENRARRRIAGLAQAATGGRS